jgi:hypothetical protein
MLGVELPAIAVSVDRVVEPELHAAVASNASAAGIRRTRLTKASLTAENVRPFTDRPQDRRSVAR